MRTAEEIDKSGRKKRTYHGMGNNIVYQDWTNIKARCNNPNNKKYEYYGGKGISISSQFTEFMDFYNYLSTLPNFDLYIQRKLTIDRIENLKGYERGNIRFATRQVQCLNQGVRKDSKTGIKGITFRGGRNKPWIARVTLNKKLIVIGSYYTMEEAKVAYDNNNIVQSILSLIDELK